jgi:hypothetical protein
MFHEAHADKDAVVLGVNYEDAPLEKIEAFAEAQMINYPIVRLTGKIDGRTTPFGPLQGLPTSFMIDPEGEVVARHTGMVDQESLEAFIHRYQALKGEQ